MIMSEKDYRAYVFGTIFALSNRLQLLGDKIDAKLTVKQWLFLAGVMNCGHEGPTLTEVAARIGTSRQNVKKIGSILERQGFILMEKDPSDARALRIKLTGACLAHLKRRAPGEQAFIETLFRGFDAGELAAFSDMLKKLEKNADEMERKIEEKE